MSVESWKLFFEIGGLIVLALTFFFGGGAWITSNVLNKRQDAQLREFRTKIADSARDTEELKKQNLETESRLERERIKRLELEALVAPRNVVVTKGVVERLRRDAGTVLRIEYRRDDNEAKRLARRIAAAVGWADWDASVKPSDESEFKPPFMEFREGVEIASITPLPPHSDLSKLPRNRAASELWEFLRANDVDAKLYGDALFLEVGKPIVVRVWPKSTPHSKSTNLEGLNVIGVDPLSQQAKRMHDAEETRRLEQNERFRKEWYPDGQ